MYSLSNMSPAQPPGHGGTHHHQRQERCSNSSQSPSLYCTNMTGNYVPIYEDYLNSEIENAKARQFINYTGGDVWSFLYYLYFAQRSVYLDVIYSGVIQEIGTDEVAKGIEETLYYNSASLEDYLNLNALPSRIEVQLKNLTHARLQQHNGASISIMEPNLNGLQSMPSSFGECNMSDIRRFPNQTIYYYGPTVIHDQSNMISDSLFLLNGTSGIIESETISEVNAHQKPAQLESFGGQTGLMMQSASYVNGNDVSFCSRDQTCQFPYNSVNSGLGNIDNNTVHACGPGMSETNFIQTAYDEPDQLAFCQHHQTGDRFGNENCSSASLILANHCGSTCFPVCVKSVATGMRMQCQSNSQCQPQQNYALGMLERIPSSNQHVKVNEMNCHYYAEYPNQSVSLHLANESASPVQVSCIDQLSKESQSEYKYINTGIQSKKAIQNREGVAEKHDSSCQPCLQVGSNDDFINQDTQGSKKGSKEGPVALKTDSIEITGESTLLRDAACTSKDFDAENYKMKKRRLFLFGLCHAYSCNLCTAEKCCFVNCIKYKKLLGHLPQCDGVSCTTQGCSEAKTMVKHYRQCNHLSCPLCFPVLQKLGGIKKLLGTPSGLNHVQINSKTTSMIETCKDLQHPAKRLKTDFSELYPPMTDKPPSSVYADCKSHSADLPINSDNNCEMDALAEPEFKKLNDSYRGGPSRAPQRVSKIDTWDSDGPSLEALENITQESTKHKKLLQTSTEHAALPADSTTESMAHSKVDCVSLTELFTPEQVRQHITSLRQLAGQSKVNADPRHSMEQPVNQNSCQLCAAEELNFEPRPVYCTQCNSRVERHSVYYKLGTGGTRIHYCTKCHAAIGGENSVACGVPFSKCELEKKINNEYIQEPWVQCDKCLGWQHQICALFNSRMNSEGHAKYTCPNCFVKEIKHGDRLAFRTAFLGAKDLPRTSLSDHIEQRLRRRLQDDLLQRDTTEGPVDEKVPGGGDLVVRVVLSVDKKVEVKKNFREIFRGNEYPAEFPYKSKVILLFQNIEGVDVCLFGMYVQEFGSECDFPNRRHVYISYLDSVKYFRPDVKLMTGESLRTFVYHEVLIGYLEYCKIRGFTSCYIWVCPPPKGEDYILYCHPKSQRTPNKNKLRKWYLSMLKKAVKEEIVTEITNLCDHFLTSTSERKVKITTARLPYYDGDYWPGFAEEKLQQFCEGEKAQCKKSATKSCLTKRSIWKAVHSESSDGESKDKFLIDELRRVITPLKADFIVVHLQHSCTRCCTFIMSGTCWLCKQCSNFRLCDKCYEAEQCLDERQRHPSKKPVKHLLHPVKILGIPSDTKDMDNDIGSEIFDSRNTYLDLCQGNYYQNDTLRRAKHSSMMLLYHLHHPSAPAFVTTCNICHLDIEPGRGLLCEVCFGYEICNSCYEKHGDSDHPHKLTKRCPSHQTRSKEAMSQVRKLNDLIVHASVCHSPSCLYTDCHKVKWLFHHAIHCTKRALKGCVYCKKMWYLLQLHSKSCLASECCVPRCSDLKMHRMRLQQQSDSLRRATITEI